VLPFFVYRCGVVPSLFSKFEVVLVNATVNHPVFDSLDHGTAFFIDMPAVDKTALPLEKANVKHFRKGTGIVVGYAKKLYARGVLRM
jgi:hypothetical protein